MASLDERLTEQFLNWACRGQGIQLWDAPVSPEPAFAPFRGHYLAAESIADDGRKETALSSLIRGWSERLAPREDAAPAVEEEDEPQPRTFSRGSLAEIVVSSDRKQGFKRDDYLYFLAGLAACAEPLAFELVATGRGVSAQFASSPADAAVLLRQLNAFFPESAAQKVTDCLGGAWSAATGGYFAAAEFGLVREFMLPLKGLKGDAFSGIVVALGAVTDGELALFQVIFEPVRHEWGESIVRSVTAPSGEAFFVNAPELVAGAREKVATPLYAAVLRIAARADSAERVGEILDGVRASLGVFESREGNALVAAENDEYPIEAHAADILTRQSRRSGMILSAEELIGFVHLPSSDVRSSRLLRDDAKTKRAPHIVRRERGLHLGVNVHAGERIAVTLSPEQRTRHMHVVGASGTGKSTFLFNLIRQDVESGGGVAVLDPHGDLVDRVLAVIPPHRIGDVVLLDPSDVEHPVGLNILRAHSDLEKTLLASDLVSVFQRLSTSWGDQMGSVLGQAVLAFLESDRGGSLLDLRRFLLEPAFRESFLESVRDPEVVYYWRKGFPQLAGSKSIGPILTRLETFLSPKSIRYMVGQRENRLDFARILDGGKIFLAKLAQGAIGRENSYLLGTLLVAKLQQTAMARQAQAESARRDFCVYIDEFHNFITPSMAEILSGARKYRLSLVLAHQELRQLERDREVASAVLSNAYTRICFRLGDQDARALESGFSFFDAKDLQNLGTGEAICRVERSDYDFNLSIPNADHPDETDAAERRRAAVEASRLPYSTPRVDVEAQLATPSLEPKASKPAPENPAAAATPPPQVVASKSVPKTEPEVGATPVPSTPGRGGKQHKYLQQFIKQWAEGMGWRTTIEAPVPGGPGSVDVLLAKEGVSVACEITITTSLDHEVRNLAKCVAGGFTHVVSVCADERRATEIESAARRSLSPADFARVRFLTVEGLFAFVAEEDAKRASKETTVRGYKVKVSYKPLGADSTAERMQSVTRVIAKSLRRLEK